MDTQLSAIDQFNIVSNQISLICLVIGVAILLFHFFKSMVTRDPKKKYDYLNLYEIRLLSYSSIFFLVAIVLVLALVKSNLINHNQMIKMIMMKMKMKMN